MVKILFAWELGGGVGHLVKIRTLALALHRRGHELYFAVKDLGAALRVLHDVPMTGLFAAPLVSRPLVGPPQPTECYPEILLHDGYGDVGRLSGALRAWQSLFQLIRPQAIIGEHAPGAMLAAHVLRVPYVFLGTGFTCPRIEQGQWPEFATRLRSDHRPCAASLDRAWNDSLRHCGLPSIESAAQVVTGARDMILACIPELDAFGPRANAMYWGNWSIAEEGATCDWPKASGPRIFAYLKARPETNQVIGLLAQRGWPTVMYLGANPAVKTAHWPQNIVLSQQPVSMTQMLREAEVMLLNGTLGTTTMALQAGVPTWHVPIYLEQILVGRQIQNLGAGSVTNGMQPQHLRELFEHGVARLDAQRRGARQMAKQSGSFEIDEQVARCVQQLESRCELAGTI